MQHLDALLVRLAERHRAALEWFIARSGTDQPWPKPLLDGTLLASKAKGIYKPSWTDYALSVRQSLTGPYPDREPVVRADGTWSYAYFQEGTDPETRDAEYANRGLVACLRDLVPVGVMRQVSAKPTSLYRVLTNGEIHHVRRRGVSPFRVHISRRRGVNVQVGSAESCSRVHRENLQQLPHS